MKIYNTIWTQLMPYTLGADMRKIATECGFDHRVSTGPHAFPQWIYLSTHNVDFSTKLPQFTRCFAQTCPHFYI